MYTLLPPSRRTHLRSRLLGTSLLLAASLPSHGEIYTWKDAAGRTHFSDSKPQDAIAKEVEVDPNKNVYSPVALPKITFTQKQKKNTKNGAMRSVRLGEVVMYSTAWCGYCGRAKDYFRRKGIPYKEYDIEKSGKARQEHAALGGGGVPVLLVGTRAGTKVVHGFSEERFEAVYP